MYPGAASNIARGASLLREDLEVLEGLVAGILRRRGEEVIVPLDELWALPPALRRHAVRMAYTMLASDRAPLDSVGAEEILELARKGEGTQYMHLPENIIVVARYNRELAFYHRAKLFFGEKDLLVGDQNFYEWSINLREVRGYDPEDAVRPEVAYLDASRGPYWVRLAREGDTIRPLGLGGTKKVYKAMMDRKVPKDLRSRVPVVVDAFGRVAWIFLGEAGEEFRVNADTEKALRLEVERI